MGKTVLHFHTNLSTFVAKDLEILKTEYKVKTFLFNPSKKLYTPLTLILQYFYLLFYIFSAKIYVVQFGGYHSFLPSLFSKLLGKKTLIVAGGTDCVAFPSIHYGNLRNNLLGKFTRWSYKLCNHITPVHQSLVYADYSYQNEDYKAQGIKAFLPALKTPITVIFNGYDSETWSPKNVERDPNLFITVASGINNASRRILKGIDSVLALAKRFPDKKFLIVGSNELSIETTSNVEFLPFVENSKLPELFSKASFYLQLSLSEGFPNALSEAMLCGCIPIVSAVGAMPDIVEKNGFILEEKNIEELAALTKKALNSDRTTLSARAREKVKKEYPFGMRKEPLLKLVKEL